jgi:hypothetical protein
LNTPLLSIVVTLALQCFLPAQTPGPKPTVIIAEGELFRPLDGNGWKVVHQEFSCASHTYGGMWTSNGGLLGAPAASDGSAATLTVQVPVAGKYRVWTNIRRPPYFNYLHRLAPPEQAAEETNFSGD